MSTADEIKALKGRGWLVNKGGETFSARVVTVNGKMTTEQMQALAAAAQKFGRGELTLTSRMSVEVPGVPASMIEAFEAALAAVGLSVGGTGPRVRPVVAYKGTLCPHGLIDTFSMNARTLSSSGRSDGTSRPAAPVRPQCPPSVIL